MRYFYDIRQIHVVVTTACNLNCSYCYEHNKHASVADIHHTQKILADYIAQKTTERILVIFHGGEPLLHFEFMHDLCEWLWRTYGENQVLISFVTNGTILTNTIKQWLWENKKRVFVSVSIDGLPAVHNRTRCNSFDNIDLPFFKSLYAHMPVKMTVPPSEIEYLYDGFIYLYEQGFIPDVSLAAETDFNEVHQQILIQQLHHLIDFYKTHYDIAVTEFLFFPFERLSPTFPDQQWKKHRCGILNARLALDTEGNEYPCQTFISDFKAKYDKEAINNIFYQIQTKSWSNIIPECASCPIREICAPCYGLNYAYRGDIDKIDTCMCESTKIIAMASAAIWAHILLHQEEYKWLKESSPDLLGHRLIGVNNFLHRINSKS